jgi:hypothetical protein
MSSTDLVRVTMIARLADGLYRIRRGRIGVHMDMRGIDRLLQLIKMADFGLSLQGL